MAMPFFDFKALAGFVFALVLTIMRIEQCKKTQKMSDGALRRHSSFGFSVLSKSYIAV
jgi:hypothetical protein